MSNEKRSILNMLEGCKNRISITDSETELITLRESALYWLDKLVKYRQNEFETAKQQDKKATNCGVLVRAAGIEPTTAP